jgi:hypothetical protein
MALGSASPRAQVKQRCQVAPPAPPLRHPGLSDVAEPRLVCSLGRELRRASYSAWMPCRPVSTRSFAVASPGLFAFMSSPEDTLLAGCLGNPGKAHGLRDRTCVATEFVFDPPHRTRLVCLAKIRM